MMNVISEIFKATIKSQSRFYWATFLLSITIQIAVFVQVLSYGFWYALASATILNWISVSVLNRLFSWDSYVDKLFVPIETRRQNLKK